MESRRWVAVTVAAAMVVSAVDGRALQTTLPSGRLLQWVPRIPSVLESRPDNNGDDRPVPATAAVTDPHPPGGADGRPPASRQQPPQYWPRREQPDGRRPYVRTTAGGAATTAVERVPYVANGNEDDDRRGRRPKPTAATTVKPRLETTTHDRSIITAPLRMCPEGQRMNPDRVCRPSFVDPEEEE